HVRAGGCRFAGTRVVGGGRGGADGDAPLQDGFSGVAGALRPRARWTPRRRRGLDGGREAVAYRAARLAGRARPPRRGGPPDGRNRLGDGAAARAAWRPPARQRRRDHRARDVGDADARVAPAHALVGGTGRYGAAAARRRARRYHLGARG